MIHYGFMVGTKLQMLQALVDSDMPHCSHRIKIDCHMSKNQNECRVSGGVGTSETSGSYLSRHLGHFGLAHCLP